MVNPIEIKQFNTNQDYIVVNDTNNSGYVDEGDIALATEDFDSFQLGDIVAFDNQVFGRLRLGLNKSSISIDDFIKKHYSYLNEVEKQAIKNQVETILSDENYQDNPEMKVKSMITDKGPIEPLHKLDEPVIRYFKVKHGLEYWSHK